MNLNKIITIGIVIVLGFLSYHKLFKSDDEKEIEALIQKVEEVITIDEPLKPLEIPGRVNALKESIIPNFRANYTDGDYEVDYNADSDLQSKAGAAALYLQEFSVFRTNTIIELRGNFADASFIAAVSGKARGGKNFSERVSVKLTLQKDGGDWLIRDARVSRLF